MSDPGHFRLRVGSLNLHAGRDRRNRSYDVVAASAALAADVFVLQEVWWPEGGTSQAAAVAAVLGYRMQWVSFGAGTMTLARAGTMTTARAGTMTTARAGTMTTAGSARRRSPTVRLDGGRGVRSPAADGERGQLGIAVLSRLPVLQASSVSLPELGRDRARRSALVVTVEAGSRDVEVIGTHMAHLSQGSLRQYGALRRLLGASSGCGVLVGDMNLWGPVVERLLPGWRRAVVGRSWPAHAPVAQPDHVLVGPGITVVGGQVLAPVGSDHRPVVADLAVAE